MLEMMLCSLFTLVPDYLYRRYVQGKRFGKEITLYSVWFELRWGITGCLILTVLLITTVFYNHPSTTNVTLFFRTVPILPETIGRVAEVNVGFNDSVKKGAQIFRLDSSKQEAAVESARRKVVEIDAQMPVARADVVKADGQLVEAKSSHQQAVDELETKQELYRRNPGNVAFREIERLQERVRGLLGAITAATAAKQGLEERITTLLPAEKASAEAALAQAQVELDKTVVRAGVDGRVEQFTLRVGDIVNPLMRPAGILIPEGAGRQFLQAGFGQIEAQIMKVGMVAEVTCVSKPFKIIPMVVTNRAGLHRCRPVPGRRAVDRSATGDAAGHAFGDARAALSKAARRRDAGQQLHRQCLFQQSRYHRCERYRRFESLRASRRGCARARARPDPAAAGAGASVPDACVGGGH